MGLKPIGDKILVTPAAEETTSKEGLILPSDGAHKPETGKVIAVGERVKKIQINDEVFFGKFAGENVEFEEKKYIFLRESEIHAIKRN